MNHNSSFKQKFEYAAAFTISFLFNTTFFFFLDANPTYLQLREEHFFQVVFVRIVLVLVFSLVVFKSAYGWVTLLQMHRYWQFFHRFLLTLFFLMVSVPYLLILLGAYHIFWQ